MIYIVDGHNLIPKLPGLSLEALDDELRLIERLQVFCRIQRSSVQVFFDRAPAGYSGARSFGSVRAHFVPQGTIADDAIARHLQVSFSAAPGGEILVAYKGQDVSREIRTEEGGRGASTVAAIPAVREALLARQREFLRAPGLVADGRDMGTVVFPSARLKVFLTASAEERARRRYNQLKEKGLAANLAGLSQEILERDRRDSARSVAPLRPATDAVVIDSTGITVDDVVNRILVLAREAFPAI